MQDTEISHLRQDAGGCWHIQTGSEHSAGTAELAAGFASEFGMTEWGRLLGLLHDRGKQSPGFQAHIRNQSGYDMAARSTEPSTHSLAGAMVAHKLPIDVLYWLSNAIAGHHRGLYDTDELNKLLFGDLPMGVSSEIPGVTPDKISCRPCPGEAHHIARMLFSCLVDADRLDTERFMTPDRADTRGHYANMQELKHRLDCYLERLSNAPASELNTLRTSIQNICADKGKLPAGFFELTVPTGGGKTIASVVWAVNHALSHGKKRIIIAIPFTSIIVQTAQTLRHIFGADNVLEHHSAQADEASDERSRLASENWDAPIIVTTNVRLFESMFSNKPSQCRKLHALCNSVVILDEAQSLPLPLLQPIVNAMRSYVKLFGASFLLCTASQPVLDGERKGLGTAVFNGLPREEIRPITDAGMMLHDRLRRVKMSFDNNPISYDTLARRLSTYGRVLCVVNTRKHALELFQRLADDGTPTFHLSRMMCPAHILDTIGTIKSLLSDGNQGLRVISTQLIEAGVDIDFPVVFRQLAGLDSLLQAAGRCNREGRLPQGDTFVFDFENEKHYGAIGFAVDALKSMLGQGGEHDWFAPQTMREYYRRLYTNTSSFDRNEINRLLGSPQECYYEEAAQKFRMIDEQGVSVIVNYGDAPALVDELKRFGPSRDLSRRLGRYSVTIRQKLFDSLQAGGLIEEPFEGFRFIPLKSQYDEATGLKSDNEYLEQTIIII